MPQLPAVLNGVTLSFGTNVNRDVNAGLITALAGVLKPYVYGRSLATGIFTVVEDPALVEAAGRFAVTSYRISGGGEAAGHSSTSRHPMGKAADISRINGVLMQDGYIERADIRAIVRKLQRAIEATTGRRENFGPYFLRKLGLTLTPQNRPDYATLAEKHKSHVHFSIN